MRRPVVRIPTAAGLALAASFSLMTLVSIERTEMAIAASATPALYGVMTCAPPLDQPERSVGGFEPDDEMGRRWNANVYDPADCLHRRIEQA